MNSVRSRQLFRSGQIIQRVAAIKAAASRAYLHRPDDEQAGQPSHASIQTAVEAAGLTFRYIPVVSGQITTDNVEDQASALDELEGPILAFCRSGGRCSNLYALIQQAKK